MKKFKIAFLDRDGVSNRSNINNGYIGYTKKYIKFFSKKNINSISLMFSPNVCLRDWNVNLKGLKNVMTEYKNIFDKAKIRFHFFKFS